MLRPDRKTSSTTSTSAPGSGSGTSNNPRSAAACWASVTLFASARNRAVHDTRRKGFPVARATDAASCEPKDTCAASCPGTSTTTVVAASPGCLRTASESAAVARRPISTCCSRLDRYQYLPRLIHSPAAVFDHERGSTPSSGSLYQSRASAVVTPRGG